MTDQRFQEILAELERWNFQEVLNMIRAYFRKQHTEEEKQAYYKINFDFNYRWRQKSSVKNGCIVGPDQVISTLRNLSDEDQYAMRRISIHAVIAYVDESGKENEYEIRLSNGSYSY